MFLFLFTMYLYMFLLVFTMYVCMIVTLLKLRENSHNTGKLRYIIQAILLILYTDYHLMNSRIYSLSTVWLLLEDYLRRWYFSFFVYVHSMHYIFNIISLDYNIIHCILLTHLTHFDKILFSVLLHLALHLFDIACSYYVIHVSIRLLDFYCLNYTLKYIYTYYNILLLQI